MAVHVVQQGECLSSIAARYGMKSWQVLGDCNADLTKKRPNPNILAPGDEVNVPDPNKRWESRPTEQLHRFVVPVPKAMLRVIVRNGKGEPFGDKRFVVWVADDVHEGKTDGRGLVEVAIPALARSARLQVWCEDGATDDDDPNIDRAIALGDLDPVELPSGVQARLWNLGHSCSVTGTIDDATIAAVRAFRAAEGLPRIPPPKSEDGEETEEDDNTDDDAVYFDDADYDDKPDEGDKTDDDKADDDQTDDGDPSHYVARLIDDAFRAALVERFEQAT